jgi:hypothetical protein
MSDGNDKPKLVPPPRVTDAARSGSPAGQNRGSRVVDSRQRWLRMAMIAVMVAGLVGVFVVLPRWQEDRATRAEIFDAPAAPERFPEGANPASETAVPADISPIFEPSATPSPTPTATPRPAPIQPQPAPPKQQPSNEQQRYVQAMSDGLEALEDGRWLAAQDAFALASRLRPGAPEVADGLARAEAGQRRESVAVNLRQAGELEQREAWREAEKLYQTVLEMDAESAAALAGSQRTRARVDLDEKLEFHIANPGRLSTAAVFDDATACLEDARDTTPKGPRLEGQISRLEDALRRASTPVVVVLESDSLTDVMVYRVGRLGSFTRRELNLKPGAYTVVGSRSGYRDVRLQLVVSPDSPPKPLVVRCTERL